MSSEIKFTKPLNIASSPQEMPSEDLEQIIALLREAHKQNARFGLITYFDYAGGDSGHRVFYINGLPGSDIALMLEEVPSEVLLIALGNRLKD